MNYTQLSQGQQPVYGTSGQPVMDLQQQLNNQNQYQPGYTPLVIDGKYGPLTQAAANLRQPSILSSTNARNVRTGLNKTFNEMLQTGDPYDQAISQMFTQQQNANKVAEENAILNSTAQMQNNQFQLEEDQRNAQATEATRALQTGESRFAPQYAQQQFDQVANMYRKRVEILRNEEAIAIAKAKQARVENDLNTYKDQINYIQQIRKAKADALTEANKRAFEQSKFDRELEFDKYKFNKNYSLDARRESRLGSSSSTDAEKPLTYDQLKQAIRKVTATAAYKGLKKKQKRDYILAQGGNPEDFGL